MVPQLWVFTLAKLHHHLLLLLFVDGHREWHCLPVGLMWVVSLTQSWWCPLLWELRPNTWAKVNAVFFLDDAHVVADSIASIIIDIEVPVFSNTVILAIQTIYHRTWCFRCSCCLIEAQVFVQVRLQCWRRRWLPTMITEYQLWSLCYWTWRSKHRIRVLKFNPHIIKLEHHKLWHQIVKVLSWLQIDWYVVLITNILYILLVIDEFSSAYGIKVHHWRVRFDIFLSHKKFKDAEEFNTTVEKTIYFWKNLGSILLSILIHLLRPEDSIVKYICFAFHLGTIILQAHTYPFEYIRS